MYLHRYECLEVQQTKTNKTQWPILRFFYKQEYVKLSFFCFFFFTWIPQKSLLIDGVYL